MLINLYLIYLNSLGFTIEVSFINIVAAKRKAFLIWWPLGHKILFFFQLHWHLIFLPLRRSLCYLLPSPLFLLLTFYLALELVQEDECHVTETSDGKNEEKEEDELHQSVFFHPTFFSCVEWGHTGLYKDWNPRPSFTTPPSTITSFNFGKTKT